MNTSVAYFTGLATLCVFVIVILRMHQLKEAIYRSLTVVWLVGVMLMYWCLFDNKAGWTFLWPLAVSWIAVVASMPFRPEGTRIEALFNLSSFEVVNAAIALMIKDISWGHALGVLPIVLVACGWFVRKRAEAQQAAREARRKRWEENRPR